LYPGHGKADALNGDGSLFHYVSQQHFGQRDGEPVVGCSGNGLQRNELTYAIHVALDGVSAEARAGLHGMQTSGNCVRNITTDQWAGVAPDEIAQLYEAAYAAEPFVEVAERPPGVRDVRETNMCRIAVRVDARTGKPLVFAAIDNLWKGAASQAVQNLNLMFGLPETAGLQ